jgi:hypothetical protein
MNDNGFRSTIQQFSRKSAVTFSGLQQQQQDVIAGTLSTENGIRVLY